MMPPHPSPQAHPVFVFVAYVSMCVCLFVPWYCPKTNVSKEKSLLCFYCFRCVCTFRTSAFHKFYFCHFSFYVSVSLFFCYSSVSVCVCFFYLNDFIAKFISLFNGIHRFEIKCMPSKVCVKEKGLQYYNATELLVTVRSATVRGNLKLWKFYRIYPDIWMLKLHTKKTIESRNGKRVQKRDEHGANIKSEQKIFLKFTFCIISFVLLFSLPVEFSCLCVCVPANKFAHWKYLKWLFAWRVGIFARMTHNTELMRRNE